MTATVSVLRFSAKPELQEHVNVALLISSGRGSDVVYDPEFPRLRCVSDIRRELVKAHLDSLQAVFAEVHAEELAPRLAALSPQFALGGQHTIPAVLTDDLLRHLKATFLSRCSSPQVHEEHRIRIATMVGGFITQRLGIAPAVAKKDARIKSLVPAASIGRRLGGVRVQRAIVGNDRVVLLNGISFRASPTYIRTRADRIRFMGYGLKSAERTIKAETGLSVRCGTVLFDEPETDLDDEQQYVIQQIKEFTTLLSSKADSDVSEFAAMAKQAVGAIA